MKSCWKFLLLNVMFLTSLWSRATTAWAEVVVLSVGSDQSLDKRAKPLSYASSDAKAFADTMIQVGAVPSSMVSFEKNPLLAEFEAKLKLGLERLKASADTSKNKFVFFFSGHADERGLHFRDGYFSKDALDRVVASLPAKTKVMIIDSCFAGLLSTKGIKDAKGFGAPKLDFDEPTGSIYLTASSSSEFAYESQKLRGGLFSRNVIDGLQGKADANSDGVVTATELYEYAFRETRLTSRMIALPGEQNPEFVANLRGRGAIALTFPVLARGHVRMMSDLAGSVRLYAAKSLNSFEHAKVKGVDDTISLPTGDYQIEVVDGNRRGMGQIRVASTATTLLTRDDVSWNSVPNAGSDVRARGVESSIHAEPKAERKNVQASIGTMGGKYLDGQVAFERETANGWLWPVLSFDVKERISRKKTVEEDILDSSQALLVGFGSALFGTEHNAVTMSGLVSGGVAHLRTHSLSHEGYDYGEFFGTSERYYDMDVAVLRAELRLSMVKGRVFVAAGGERPVVTGKSSLSNDPTDFITARLGFNVPL